MDFGLIGEKLGHSYSPLIHKCFGDYDYRLCPMTREQMEETLRKRDFRGLNVTIPYKTAVLPFCDEVSDTVRYVGSANTLILKNGRLRAYNTDLQGMLFMLARGGISLNGKKVVILGSGGTSLTARAACQRENARETVTVSRKGPVDYDALYQRHTDAEIILNATPVGMYPNNLVSPVDLSKFPRLQGTADVIYNPSRTSLLLDAEERGVPHVGGLWMLAAQGWAAAQLFLDREIPPATVERAYGAVRRESLNLVLIGMPGSGKTTLGRLAARCMGRPFIDLDAEIEKRFGPIPAIFASRGEAAFRDMESEIVALYGKEKGLVIATGGGAVLRPQNVRAFRQNGVVAWVQRPVEQLSTRGRPLSTDLTALRRMEQTREPKYRSCADFCVKNEGELQDAANRLREGFDEAVGFERPEPEHAGHSGKAPVRGADL